MHRRARRAAAAPRRRAPTEPAARRERDDLYDRLLRKTAEFDNYPQAHRARAPGLTEWAAADLLDDLLPVIDDFDRALAAEAPPAAQALQAASS